MNTIVPTLHGPYEVRGELEIVTADGRMLLAWIDASAGRRNALQFAQWSDGHWQSAPRTVVVGDALIANGAKEVYAYISHGVLSGGAVTRISGSRLKELVITDSIQPTKEILAAGNIRILEIASLIGEAIGRTATEESVSSLFD